MVGLEVDHKSQISKVKSQTSFRYRKSVWVDLARHPPAGGPKGSAKSVRNLKCVYFSEDC